MNLLQNQITEMSEQLELLDSSNENKVAMHEFAVIIERLHPVREELLSQKDSRMLLGNLPPGHQIEKLTVDGIAQAESVQFLLDKFVGVWDEKNYEAREDDSLDNARLAIDTLARDLSSLNSQTWDKWLGHLAARFETADAALDSQKDVSGLQDVVQKFREKRDLFRELTNSIPDDSDIIDEISSLVDELEILRSKMDFDLPEEVKVFFEKISDQFAGYQVALTFLTPEVIQWLSDKGELKNFTVRRKGMY
jgi:hypothetical protein